VALEKIEFLTSSLIFALNTRSNSSMIPSIASKVVFRRSSLFSKYKANDYAYR